MAKISTITENTKTPLKNIGVIIVFTIFLHSIKSDITELRLTLEGRLTLDEYRITQIETGQPISKVIPNPPPAILPPPSPVAPGPHDNNHE